MRGLGDFWCAQRAVAEILLVGVARVFIVVAVQAFLTVHIFGM